MSEHNIDFERDVIHRLASLEATFASSVNHLNEKIDKYQEDMHGRYASSAADVANMRGVMDTKSEYSRKERERIRDELDVRITALERFKTEALAKLSAIGFGAAFIWAVFGNAIGSAVERMFN